VARPPGSEVVLGVNYWDGLVPEGGDFLRTRAGSCYQVLEFRPSRAGSKSRGRLRCVKLDRDAVLDGQPGVWRWEFSSRGR
jgi:hypothetical protein